MKAFNSVGPVLWRLLPVMLGLAPSVAQVAGAGLDMGSRVIGDTRVLELNGAHPPGRWTSSHPAGARA